MEPPALTSPNNPAAEDPKPRRIRIPYFAGREEQQFLFLTIIIGILAGAAVVAFILVTDRLGAHIYGGGANRWQALFWPIEGSLAAGYLLWRYFPAAQGSGVPQTKAAFFAEPGYVPLCTVLGKFFCTSLSLSSGIPLGREGPSVQVGAGIASLLGGRRSRRLWPFLECGGELAIVTCPEQIVAALDGEADTERFSLLPQSCASRLRRPGPRRKLAGNKARLCWRWP